MTPTSSPIFRRKRVCPCAWKQDNQGVRTYFLYDGGNPILELDPSGAVKNVNVFAPDGLVARKEGSTWTYYTFDPQGNVLNKLDSSQNVTAGRLLDAWGQGVETTLPRNIDPWGYNARWGYYYDRETQLYLCQHRVYDASTGRWLNRDPIGLAGGMNLYGYCASGPVGAADPRGLTQLDKAGAVVAMEEAVPGSADVIYSRIPAAIKWLARTGLKPITRGGRILGPATTTLLADGDSSEIQLAENAAMSVVRLAGQRACELGTQFHSMFFEGFERDSNYLVNRVIPSSGGLRPDLLDKVNKIIVELKPDNTRALNDGIIQLMRYIEAAEEYYGGGGWKGLLIPYTSPWSPGVFHGTW